MECRERERAGYRRARAAVVRARVARSGVDEADFEKVPGPGGAGGSDVHRPAGAGKVAGFARHGDWADSPLEPDLAGLDVGDLEVVLSPVLLGDLVGVDVGRAGREVVQDHPQAVGDRQIARGVARTVAGVLGGLIVDVAVL